MTADASTLPVMETLEDGSFPIRTEADLRAALKHPNALEAADHILARAEALELTQFLPDGWTGTSAVADSDFSAGTVTITVDTGAAEEQVPRTMDGGPWRALLVVEGEPTEDGRMIAPGATVWRSPPLSLTAMDFSQHGEQGPSVIAGRVDRIWREGNEIWGEGVFNTDEFGSHIEELYSNGSLGGNSVEAAGATTEIWDRETMTALEPDQVLQAITEGRDLLHVFTHYVIGATTLCPVQAIEQARTEIATSIAASGLSVLFTSFYTLWSAEEVLTASAAGLVPLHPPAAWFEKPLLHGPTPLTITDEGQVYGHPALWNTCHVAEPSGPGVCVPPPRSGMNYEAFHHGVLRTAEGHDVVVGQLTLGTLHAGRDLGWRETIAHYENSGLAFADVHAYEDQWGIVVAGALRPDVPAAKVREAKAGALSGDWRDVLGRGLEFVAALVVNVAGFPIPRPEARIVASATGEEHVLALVAAGMVPPAEEVDGMSRREYLRTIRSLTDGSFRTYTAEQRRKMADNGQALPDGSFPIADCADASNAIRSVGRASNRSAAEAHIRKRVKTLGCSGGIFDNWK